MNGFTIPIDEWDIELNEDDIVVLLDRTALPAGYIAGSILWTALANLAISVTLSYVVSRLFEPDAPSTTENAQPSSVYAINSGQNMARFGNPIPIIYGTVRMYPSMIVQPYYRYEDNIEYLNHVMCIGQGICTTDDILIADDDVTSTGDLQWKLLTQADFYNIPLNAYGTHITNTLPSPSNYEMRQENGESEKYRISADTKTVEFDYNFPQGLYYRFLDGEFGGAVGRFIYKLYTLSGTTYTEVFSQTVHTQAYDDEPIQITRSQDVTIWQEDLYISFTMEAFEENSQLVNKLYIKRLKEIYPNKDFTQAYGNITLLACKIKSSNAVSSAGQVKVNGWFTRTDKSNRLDEVLRDIYTNTTYGAGLNGDDLDFPVTTETVNCAYDQNQTIFDAMRKPAMSQKYSLFLAGMDVILKKDAPNDITSGMYNEMNILRNSLKVQYLFKEENPTYDSYICSYFDEDWTPQTVIYPSNGYRSQTVDLFGVSGAGGEAIAEEMAMYLWKQDEFRRKVVTFQTDIQGLVPQYLDKILVSHSAMQWGEAGEVYNRDNDNLELSDALVDTSTGQTIVFRNIDGSVSDPYAITIIDEYNITVVGMPEWVTNNIFYTIQSAGTGREFIVVSVKPNGEAVEIQAIDYNPEIYT